MRGWYINWNHFDRPSVQTVTITQYIGSQWVDWFKIYCVALYRWGMPYFRRCSIRKCTSVYIHITTASASSCLSLYSPKTGMSWKPCHHRQCHYESCGKLWHCCVRILLDCKMQDSLERGTIVFSLFHCYLLLNKRELMFHNCEKNLNLARPFDFSHTQSYHIKLKL